MVMKHLSKPKQRFIVGTTAVVGLVLLGFGAFTGVTFLHHNNNNNKSSSSSSSTAAENTNTNATASTNNNNNNNNNNPKKNNETILNIIPTKNSTNQTKNVFDQENNATSTNNNNTATPNSTTDSTIAAPEEEEVPSSAPSIGTVDEITTFYAIGDVPYTDRQAIALEAQVLSIPMDAEFLIHLGDMRFSKKDVACQIDDYTSVAETLKLSRVPVFIVPGDNDAQDCPNREESFQYWKDTFHNFADRYWPNHTLGPISYDPDRPSNFHFTHKGTLYAGLNLVNGRTTDDKDELVTDMIGQATYTINTIINYTQSIYPNKGRIVLFGHADPKRMHSNFFDPIANFIQANLYNQVPVLYMGGSRHEWYYEPDFYDVPMFLRITVQGQTSDPPLKMTIDANGKTVDPDVAYTYNRMLPPGHPALNGTDAGCSAFANATDADSVVEEDSTTDGEDL